MKTAVVCCVCGKHLRWIDTPRGGVSHGYCRKHFEEAMREVEEYWETEDRRAMALSPQPEKAAE